MSDILVRALSLVAIIGIGYGAKRVGWVKASHFPMFARIMMRVTLPCALATGFNSATVAPGLLGIVALAFGVNVLQQLAAALRYRHDGARGQAFGILHGGTYNIGAFTIPYVTGFMGPGAVLFASLFDVGNVLAAAGVGYAWAMSLTRGRAITLRSLTRDLMNPILLVYVSLIVLRLLHLSLPAPVISFTSLVGAANPFMAMFMIGIGLALRPGRAKVRSAWRRLVWRYTFAVAFAAAIWLLVPYDKEIRLTLVLCLFAPIASMVPGFVAESDGDVELSTYLNSASILVAVIAMPAAYLVLTSSWLAS